MLRYLLTILCSLVLFACTADPVIDLDQLEANARGGDQQATVQLIDLLSAKEPGVSDRIYAIIVEIGERAPSALLKQVKGWAN